MILHKILQHPPRGATEIMVHPGIPEDSRDVQLGNPVLERYLTLEDRRRELAACVRARELGARRNLVSFHTLARSSERDG